MIGHKTKSGKRQRQATSGAAGAMGEDLWVRRAQIFWWQGRAKIRGNRGKSALIPLLNVKQGGMDESEF